MSNDELERSSRIENEAAEELIDDLEAPAVAARSSRRRTATDSDVRPPPASG